MNIDGLKRQHQEIGQLINEIESSLNQDVVAKAFDISLKIASLAGKLSIHLKSEDDYLYPTLMTAADEGLRNTAKRFDQEMGHISQAFSDYKTKYMSASRIKQETGHFLADTRAIISSLRHRIHNEDKSLYSLL